MTPKISLLMTIFLLFAAEYSFSQIDRHVQLYGPIKIRNHFPATLPFLGFSPESAWLHNEKKLSLSIDYIRSNTFVKSGNLVRNLQNEDQRNVLSSDIVNRFLSGEPQDDIYLLDTEARNWRFRISYGLSKKVALSAELPIVQYGGGIFDRFIEHFHSTFGLPDDKRPLFVRNTSETLLYLDGQLLFREPGRLKGAGFGDLVFATKFRIAHNHKVLPEIAAQIAIKAPTGNYRQLRGSGSFDYGMNLIAAKKLKKNILHLNAGIVWPGKWKALPKLRLAPIYSALIGYERLIGKSTAFVFQRLFTTSIFRKASNSGIADDSYEFTVGVKFGAPSGFRWNFS
ncbi:MAG: DUF3187 family protein, partial [bacterium]